jgi:hypothetical protein
LVEIKPFNSQKEDFLAINQGITGFNPAIGLWRPTNARGASLAPLQVLIENLGLG